MRSFALALVAGIAAAVPQYGSEGDYGYGGYPEAPATTVAPEYSAPAYPEYTSVAEYTSAAVEYPEYPAESSVVEYSSYEETKTSEVAYPTYPAESSVEVPYYPATSAVESHPAASTGVEYPVESPCPSSTVTVTVTVPAGGEYPTTKVVSPPYPTGTGAPTTKVYPTGTGVPSSHPSPPTFTGAASHANAGLFVAGAGAFAAFFL